MSGGVSARSAARRWPSHSHSARRQFRRCRAVPSLSRVTPNRVRAGSCPCLSGLVPSASLALPRCTCQEGGRPMASRQLMPRRSARASSIQAQQNRPSACAGCAIDFRDVLQLAPEISAEQVQPRGCGVVCRLLQHPKQRRTPDPCRCRYVVDAHAVASGSAKLHEFAELDSDRHSQV